jgi:hypothetical protein
MVNDYENYSPVARLLALARRTGLDGEIAPVPLRMVSFRLPVSLLASASAIATMTGQSRNTTLIDLVEAGVFSVVNSLDDSTQYEALRQHFLKISTDTED